MYVPRTFSDTSATPQKLPRAAFVTIFKSDLAISISCCCCCCCIFVSCLIVLMHLLSLSSSSCQLKDVYCWTETYSKCRHIDVFRASYIQLVPAILTLAKYNVRYIYLSTCVCVYVSAAVISRTNSPQYTSLLAT